MTTREYKNLKGLKKENLRDNMSTTEIILNMLAETATTELSRKRKPNTFKENKEVANEGGSLAGDTRKALEEKLGNSVITKKNTRELGSGR